MISEEEYNDLSNSYLLIKNNINKYEFDKHCPIYPVTTENIKAYYKFISFKKKDVLTVCSSGDHAFNAILKGAKSVDSFDINKLTKYYLYLRKAALLSLDSHEYIDFFIRGNQKKLFNNNTYQVIRKNLNEEIKFFWDSLFYENKNLRNTKLFSRDEDSRPILLERNEYLKLNNYKIVKNKINNIKMSYYNVDLLNIPYVIKKKYDIILLSNISDYLQFIFGNNRLEKYSEFIKNKLSKNLNPNGIIVSSYIFDYKENENHDSYLEIDNPILRNKVFDKTLFTTYKFKSNKIEDKEDAVMIYKKVLKD